MISSRQARSFQTRLRRVFIRLETPLRMRLLTCVCKDLWCRNLTWARSILFLESSRIQIGKVWVYGVNTPAAGDYLLRVYCFLMRAQRDAGRARGATV